MYFPFSQSSGQIQPNGEPPAEDAQTGNAGAGAAHTNGSSTLSKEDGPATLSKKAKKTAAAATVAPATPTSPAIKGVLADILSVSFFSFFLVTILL